MFSLREYMFQLLICVLFEEDEYSLYAYSMRGGVLKKTYDKSFEDKKRLLRYIDNLSQNYQIYYISVFLDSPEQGLVPVSDKDELRKFGVEAKTAQCINLSNAQVYTTKNIIKEYKKLFSDYGELDLIYSPFALLYHCINTKIKMKKGEKKLTLYIYKHNSYIALIVCEGKKILFGSFTDISPKNTENESENETEGEAKPEAKTEEAPKEEQPAPQEAAEAEQAGESDELKELDSLLDENADKLKYVTSDASDLSNFGSDMDMCSYVFSSIQEFYNNPIYNGAFIDELVIFDNDKISQAVLDYLEGEIFLQPKVIQINTFNLMRELMCKELEI